MTTTNAVNGAPSGAYGSNEAITAKSHSNLSQEEFLQLLSVQFQQQDPFNPTSDTEFMAQMAQFSALEQMSELNREFARFRSQNEFALGSNLVGKEVTISDANGNRLNGVVEGLLKESDGYFVKVAGELHPLSSVEGIYQPAPTDGAVTE